MSKVYFVGGGPGEPGLITCRGRRLLERADVVVYGDVAPALVEIAPAGAERIHCEGDTVAAVLIERARRGLEVVRLEPGDPFLFGLAAGEAEAVAAAGIAFEVVPGVTAVSAAAAYCGARLAGPKEGWVRLERGEAHIGQCGPETPAIAVYRPASACQRVVEGTLAEVRRLSQADAVIAGEPVLRRSRLNWFERLPLHGKSVVITRAREQAGELGDRFAALGAEVIEFPTIEIQPAADYSALDAAIDRLNSYDWLIFTSANGVRFFLERLDRSAADLRALRARICAIGPATRRAVERLHLKVDLMPEEYVAESLVAAFSGLELESRRILLPRAAVARDVVPVELSRRGAQVDVVEAYRTGLPDGAREAARRIFAGEGRPDWITFTSSSTVNNFVEAAGVEALEGVRVASIGPVTTATARKRGIEVTVEARIFTVEGLVEAVTACTPAVE